MANSVLLLDLLQLEIAHFLHVLSAFGNMTKVLGLLLDILVCNFYSELFSFTSPSRQRMLDVGQLFLLSLGQRGTSILFIKILIFVTQDLRDSAKTMVTRGVVFREKGTGANSGSPSLYAKLPANVNLFPLNSPHNIDTSS